MAPLTHDNMRNQADIRRRDREYRMQAAKAGLAMIHTILSSLHGLPGRSLTRRLWLTAGLMLAGQAGAATLLGVQAVPLPGGGAELRLELDETVGEPKTFALTDPPRIVMDLTGVRAQVKPRSQALSVGPVSGINIVETPYRTRIVVVLERGTGFRTAFAGNRLLLALGDSLPRGTVRNGPEVVLEPGPALTPAPESVSMLASTPPAPPPVGAPPTPIVVDVDPVVTNRMPAPVPRSVPVVVDPPPRVVTPVPITAPPVVVSPAVRTTAPTALPPVTPIARPALALAGPHIQDIDFRRGQDGQGRVLIDLSDSQSLVDVKQRGNTIHVEIGDTALPRRLAKSYDVLDFGTPVRRFIARERGDDVKLEISAFGDFDHVVYQTETRLTIEVKPLTEADIAEREDDKPTYTGERISLNFQNIEIRRLLQVLADFANVNIVVSDRVQGSMALRLINVPWDQALDIILLTKGLDKRREGNVILVDDADRIAEREQAERAAKINMRQLAPLRTEFIRINYAKAADLAELIQSQVSGQGRTGSLPVNDPISLGIAIARAEGQSRGLLSSRGTISVDGRTNTLIVQDTAEKLVELRKLIQRLDVPVRQVLIESRIVVANDDFSRDVGVRFGVTAVDQNDSGDIVAFTGSQAGANVLIDSGRAGDNPLAVPGSVPPGAQGGGGAATLIDRFGVNLPAVNPDGFPVGRFGLAFLSSDVLVDLELSALQAEGKGELLSNPRVITANQREALIEQGVEIPFQEAASSGATSVSFKKAVLSLTVTPQITPDDRIILDLAVTSDSRGQDTPAGPAIDTREVRTQVLVKNGETVVLGGIFEQDQREAVQKVPVLGDAPLVGRLFRRNSRVNRKRELLVFVTPKILDERLSLER